MDFLSAKRKKKGKKEKEKTPEGKLWVTFHMVKYGGGWGAWRWRMGGVALETAVEGEIIARGDKGRGVQ